MMAMRPIQVSTDVYAAIWAARKTGEDSEEEILRRTFGVATPEAASASLPATVRIGFSDLRFGIELPEGFQIFRTYRGVEYRAKAINGAWMLMSSGDLYPSLNQLSRAIGTKVENAWYNWYFIDTTGRRQLVTKLRKG